MDEGRTLAEVLEQFEAEQVFDEHLVMKRVQHVAEPQEDARHEHLAFSFSESGKSPWGTHFGPMFQGTNADGNPTMFPDIVQVTTDVLDYWQRRAGESRHPVMRARYSGLVWEFARVVGGRSRDPEMARLRVDAVIAVADGNRHKYATNTWTMLEHAFSLAGLMKDGLRVKMAIKAILDFEMRVGDDDKPGLWGPAFDLLYGKKKLGVTSEQERELIQRLEQRLARLAATGEDEKAWSAEAAAEKLARHYRRNGLQEDVERVLLAAGGMRERAATRAKAMVAQSWLQRLYELYAAFGLRDHAARLLKRIAELGPGTRDEMKEVRHSFEISEEQIQQIVGETLEGSFQEVHLRLVVRYIPRLGDVKEQLARLSSSAPISFLIPRQLMDEDGRPVATIDTLDADPDGHLVLFMVHNIGFSAIFVRRVMDAMVTNGILSESVMQDLVDRSPLFVARNEPLVMEGVRAYLKGDAIGSIHLLVPQIEAAVRQLAGLVGAPILKPNRSGGMDHRLFDEHLRDPLVTTTLTEDVATYLRVLFTDRRGINLRNSVCHGFIPAASFTMGLADRVMHTVLLLLLVDEDRGEE